MKRLVAGFAALLCTPWTVLADDVAEATIGGNELRAGGHVEFDEEARRNAFVSGGDVTVRGVVGRNLYAAGGDVRLEGVVDGDARMAGWNLGIGPEARIAGDAMLAGGNIVVDGSIGGDLTAFGDHIELNGIIDGDVRLAGGELRLGPEARIGGRVTYRSGDDLIVDPGAQVAGGVRQSADERAWRRFAHGATVVGGVTLSFGLLLLGALMILVMPRFTREAAESIRRLPWQTIGIGCAVLVGVPVLCAMLIITLVGIPLAVLLAFFYGALLVLGYLVGAVFLGDFVLGRIDAAKLDSAWWRMLFLLLAIVAIAIVKIVPILGPLACGVLFLAGLGAFSLRAWRGLRTEPATV
jgi:cytoskeletal protein CcmA (bactofilin family)